MTRREVPPPIRVAMIIVGCAVPLLLGEGLIRGVLPPAISPVASVFGVLASLSLGWGVSRRRGWSHEAKPPGVDMPGAENTLDRAAAELGTLFAERSAAVLSDSRAGVVDFPQPGAGEARMERAISELSDYPTFTEILKKQMCSVIELSDSAATSILTNLNHVDKRIVALLKSINQSGADDKVAHVISEIESQIYGCRQMLDSFASRQAEDARLALQQLAKISGDTHEVLNAIQGVNGIARQTTMLSVNVSIEAARAGEAGRGFAVIGTEIRNLAAKVQELSNEVHHRVEALMRAVTVDLEQQAKLREESQRDAIANIATTLNALHHNLSTIVTYNRDVMKKVEIESEAIGSPISEMMADIQFQDIIRQQLEQLNQMAGMVDEHFQSLGAALADKDEGHEGQTLLQKLDGQFGNYVMSRQRQSHLAARGQVATQDGVARIELF